MICRILLLIILTSHVCAATFVVNVTQSSYQTEENHNITLEWTFTPKPEHSSSFLFIYCNFRNHLGVSAVLYMFDGVDILKYQHEQFSGRVQSDKDALTEGRLSLLITKLRTEDSGRYLCKVATECGGDSASCEVLVSAADLQSQTPTIVPEQEAQEKNRSYAAAGDGGLIAVGVVPAAALQIICVKVLVNSSFNI